MQLGSILADARAWRGDSLAAAWRFGLSAECLAALAGGGDRPDPHCLAAMQPVAMALEEGPGFAVIEGLGLERYGREGIRAAYWALGRCLGEPLEQNVEGDLLYDVRDTGRDVAEGARFSVTNAESTFHIDSAFSPQIPDYVGLLCLRSARTGGQSQLVSAYALHDALLEECPEVLDALYGDFCFDRRGQYQAGEDPVHRAPILAWDGRELTMRYLRYYIEVGHERAEVALNEEQTRALAVVEGLLQRPEFRVEFALEPGQMLFTNNHWILHNRTAFEDFADPELRRHYVRLWLGRRGD
jgi:alpha-ketoglutarate-dependent taurine dioxygenase